VVDVDDTFKDLDGEFTLAIGPHATTPYVIPTGAE
jgi:hypothetical protein